MQSIRLEVRQRTLLLDQRDYVFVTEDGVEVTKTTTQGVVEHAERWVKRHLRGPARVHGRAQILQSLLTNAAEATAEGGRVKLRTSRCRSSVSSRTSMLRAASSSGIATRSAVTTVCGSSTLSGELPVFAHSPLAAHDAGPSACATAAKTRKITKGTQRDFWIFIGPPSWS